MSAAADRDGRAELPPEWDRLEHAAEALASELRGNAWSIDLADTAAVIDTSRLVYVGGSQGGIMGGALTAFAQDWTRSVLGVPGMNYSLLLRRSVDFDTYAAILGATARIEWKDLEPHFARGELLVVDSTLDLVTVAQALIDDDRRKNLFGLLTSLNALIETGDGFDYTSSDFTRWAMDAGFRRTEVIPLIGPTSAIIAYK